MKLRTRLWVGFALIVAIVAVAGVVAVSTQRDRLSDQIDDRLLATPLPPGTRAPPGVEVAAAEAGERVAPAQPAPQRVDDESISDLYVAVINSDATIRPVVIGLLLDDVPDLGALPAEPATSSQLTTVDGIEGTQRFRVLVLPGEANSLETIVAIPIDDVDETLRQLSLTFAAMAGLIVVASLAIVSWVTRYGLQPLHAMTDVADAISAGERGRRAEVADDGTEAGQLGQAFNLMLDEQEHSEARLRRFVSNASHELRTPLTSIRGYVDLYRSGGFRNEGQLDDAMRRVQFEAERMNGLVEDLLLLAKFDEEAPIERSAIDLAVVVDDVVALALAAHPDRTIEVVGSGPIPVEADRFRLHQALTAVVDNAIQHTPAGSTVQVVARSDDEAASVSVIDDGPGLTEAEATAVFERFHRGDASRSRSTGGSGLGLSIARSIVAAHGGEIAATATPGEGATFTITLPAAPAP